MLPLPLLLLPHILSYFAPQLSLHQSSYIFLYSLFPHPVSHLPFLYFFNPLFPFVLQASELGMTSAFYKYILTTMVRARHILAPVSSIPPFSLVPLSPAPPLLSLYERAKVQRRRKYQMKGEERGDRGRKKGRGDEGRGEGKREI